MGRKQIKPEKRGRRPLPYGIKEGVALGRFQLIALHVNDCFGFYLKGEAIDRKKISSHIQVLKKFFENGHRDG